MVVGIYPYQVINSVHGILDVCITLFLYEASDIEKPLNMLPPPLYSSIINFVCMFNINYVYLSIAKGYDLI